MWFQMFFLFFQKSISYLQPYFFFFNYCDNFRTEKRTNQICMFDKFHKLLVDLFNSHFFLFTFHLRFNAVSISTNFTKCLSVTLILFNDK